MTSFNDQVLRHWTDWEETTGDESGDPDAFVSWAIENRRLLPRPQDVRKLLRRQVTTALRQASRVDDNGVTYRAKQCVTLFDGDIALKRWFDTDNGGTSNLRQKAVRQRRDGIANDVFRAMCDVEHMNTHFPKDTPLQFVLDFTDDYEEKKAAAQRSHDGEDDEDAA